MADRDFKDRVALFVAASLALAAACSAPTGSPSDAGGVEVGAPDVADTGASEVGASDAADTGASEVGSPDVSDSGSELAPVTFRVATFNASLFRATDGELVGELAGGDDAQAGRVAEVLQRARPDVVLINEFDWDADGEAARVFAESYLAVSQRGAEPLSLPYRYVPATNTGVFSGVDLDGSGAANAVPGSAAYGNDAFGYGVFPGQYGMVIYSRFPLVEDGVRTFANFLWRDMPQSLLPTDWYSEEAAAVMRLSSKNHVDLAIDVDGHVVHLLASHPTPPSFDGAEDRNGRRNHDEVRFWVDYLSQESYIRDDAGVAGGLAADAAFVVLGDLNSDPADGDSRREALLALLSHARVVDPQPESAGGASAAAADGGANTAHTGDPRLDTADFSDGRVGNLRVDYVLPSSSLELVGAGVFWPAPGDAHADLADVSDHHLVWVDVIIGL